MLVVFHKFFVNHSQVYTLEKNICILLFSRRPTKICVRFWNRIAIRLELVFWFKNIVNVNLIKGWIEIVAGQISGFRCRNFFGLETDVSFTKIQDSRFDKNMYLWIEFRIYISVYPWLDFDSRYLQQEQDVNLQFTYMFMH